MTFKFNPFLGVLDRVDGSTTNTEKVAVKVSETFDCESSTEIDDLVVFSQTVDNKVETITSNVYSDLVLGIVVDKPTPTTAEVLVSGKWTLQTSSLSRGKPVYVGQNGKVSTVKPTSGHLQTLGLAITPGTLFIMPSLTKVVQA